MALQCGCTCRAGTCQLCADIKYIQAHSDEASECIKLATESEPLPAGILVALENFSELSEFDPTATIWLKFTDSRAFSTTLGWLRGYPGTFLEALNKAAIEIPTAYCNF